MSYTPNTWNNNDLVTATKMNHIEQGIQNLDNLVSEPIILTIPTSSWSGNGPYTLNVTNSNVTANQPVSVSLDESSDYLTSDLSITTIAGGLTLSTATLPTGTLKVTIFLLGTTMGATDTEVIPDVYSSGQVDTMFSNVYSKTQVDSKVAEMKCLAVNCGTISGLPVTINNVAIKNDMIVLKSTLSNPSAQSGDWEIITTNGSLTINGAINGSTTLTLYLVHSTEN